VPSLPPLDQGAVGAHDPNNHRCNLHLRPGNNVSCCFFFYLLYYLRQQYLSYPATTNCCRSCSSRTAVLGYIGYRCRHWKRRDGCRKHRRTQRGVRDTAAAYHQSIKSRYYFDNANQMKSNCSTRHNEQEGTA